MNWDQIETNWKEFSGSARAHWSKLSEDDWKTITGKKDDLAGCIQKRYGIAKEDAEKQIDKWSGALLEVAETLRTH
jgi:uncharacterized protein YjbJ (UPF0337 family)